MTTFGAIAFLIRGVIALILSAMALFIARAALKAVRDLRVLNPEDVIDESAPTAAQTR